MRYRLDQQVVLRIAGFPVELIESLSCPRSATDADALLDADAALDRAAAALIAALEATKSTPRGLDRRVQQRQPLEAGTVVDVAEAEAYRVALARRTEASERLEARYAGDLERARDALYDIVADEDFRHVLFLSTPSLEALTPHEPIPPPPRSRDVRRREHTWISYLQRLTTKNETISFFGPSAWGRVDPSAVDGLRVELDPDRRIAARSVYLERWAADAIVQAMLQDPEAAPFARAALAEHLRLEGDRAISVDDDQVIALTPAQAELVRRCPDARVGELDRPTLEQLVATGILTIGFDLTHCAELLDELRREVDSWPDGGARARWLERLARVSAAVSAVERAPALDDRRPAMAVLAEALAACGVVERRASRALYTPRLPINEDCKREMRSFVLGRDFVDAATVDLAPWYELWRDLAGLYATRVHDKIAAVWRQLGGAPVPLGKLVAACSRAGVPLGRAAGLGLVPELEQEIQEAWQAQLGDRATAREVALTDDDLAFVRARFAFRRMKAFDHPSADFQVLADSAEAVRDGRWSLLLGELHPGFVFWQEGALKWCDDLPALVDDYRRGGHGATAIYGGLLQQQTVHTFNRTHEHTEGWSVIGSFRMRGVTSHRAAEALVTVTDDDVLAFAVDGAPLGSLLNRWDVAFNTHRLELLGTGAHSPRLSVGRVIVQRESWCLESDDLLRQALKARGAGAFAALRALRRRNQLPEQVFVRPQLPVKTTNHKDAKPMFVDFRNPILLEVLGGLAEQYRALRISEMLPSSEQCWLGDVRGRYSFELRVQAHSP